MNTKMIDATSVLEEVIEGSDTLVIIFGGISQNLGIPHFEFFKSTGLLRCSRIFLRDSHQSWYQRGLPGVGQDIYGICSYLEKRILSSKAGNIVFVGNSMGGYGAILFASMLGVGQVLTFSPQTYIDPFLRILQGDYRWQKEILRTLICTWRRPHIYDLLEYIQAKHYVPQIDIIYSTLDPLDTKHAKRLAVHSSVNAYPLSYGGHGLVKELRDRGELAKIFGRFVHE